MNDGTTFDRWSIVLVPFPYSDLTGIKRRPALILSNREFNRTHDDVVCCLITSKTDPEPDCPIIHAEDLVDGGLPFESKIKPHRLFTVEKSIVLRTLGILGPIKSNETRRALMKLFSFSPS